MIKTLYEKFQPWSEKGSVYLISDTHFEDHDCETMDPNWISPEEHIKKIKSKVHKGDTLIHLGDVGNPEWLKQIKAYKVLIMGNHDETVTKFKPYFDEIYQGPLFIAEKILLSHEPFEGLMCCINIHGHDHSGGVHGWYSINIASNVVGYDVINLKDIINSGALKRINSIHRETIDRATAKKKRRNI